MPCLSPSFKIKLSNSCIQKYHFNIYSNILKIKKGMIQHFYILGCTKLLKSGVHLTLEAHPHSDQPHFATLCHYPGLVTATLDRWCRCGPGELRFLWDGGVGSGTQTTQPSSASFGPGEVEGRTDPEKHLRPGNHGTE